MYTFDDLLSIMERLMGDNGCPWDRAQTHESLKICLLEECYEVIDAIDNKDSENLCEELGDVLLQVVFHSLLAKKEGSFSIDEVINGISGKMVNRHRHIFGDAVANTPEEVIKTWEQVKKEEKGYKNNTDQLRSVPRTFPALVRCQKVLGKAEKLLGEGEDSDKLIAELQNQAEALKSLENLSENEKMDKIGKILMLITNISRKNQINSEFALTNALETYINRFENNENT